MLFLPVTGLPLRAEAEVAMQAAKTSAEANLELALSAAQIFEQWVQLEPMAPPSMLSTL